LDNLTCVEQRGAVTGTGCTSQPSSDASSAWRVRRFSYDGLSRLTSATNPESGAISYTYDDAGNVKSKTSPAPNQPPNSSLTQAVTYCYDALNRLTKKFYAANPDCVAGTANVTYFYDQTAYNGLTVAYGIGRRTGMSDGSGQTAWGFDPAGRVAAERRTVNGVTKQIDYTYNLDGSLATLAYPHAVGVAGHTLAYAPSAAGRVLSALDSGSGINYAQSA